jgi:lipoprotein-anchoring transpeptidase ErfK/SrfK
MNGVFRRKVNERRSPNLPIGCHLATLLEARRFGRGSVVFDEQVQSTSMYRTLCGVAAAGTLSILVSGVAAQPISLDPTSYSEEASSLSATTEDATPPIRLAQIGRNHMGGGFIEFLFSGGDVATPRYSREPQGPGPQYVDPSEEPAQQEIDPKYLMQAVAYDGTEPPGTIIIDTPRKFLFLVQPSGKALRYGIGVGRPGFTWAGVKQVSMKREWPDWRPPPEMLKRRPDLPSFMAGGPENPLGARALYLGSSMYRIHGSNEPWTIGTQVSSGCIRMRNEDVMDLYDRVRVGTKVIVL